MPNHNVTFEDTQVFPKKEILNWTVSPTRGLFFTANQEIVKVALLDYKGTVLGSEDARSVQEQLHPADRVYLNNRNYFIRNGTTFLGLDILKDEVSYKAEGLKTGLATFKIISNNNVIGSIKNVPVIASSTMTVKVLIDQKGSKIDKMRFSLNTDPDQKREISWVDNYDYKLHVRAVIISLVRKSGLTTEEQIYLLEALAQNKFEDFSKSANKYTENQKIKQAYDLAEDVVLEELSESNK